MRKQFSLYAKKFWGVGVFVVVSLSTVFALTFVRARATPAVTTQPVSMNTEQEDTLTVKTITPIPSSDGQSLTLIGTIVSNEFATIYARRNGIIKDLYIDIGDQVRENQQIAELLPPGDLGQSSANIYEKQVRVQEAETDLAYLQQVAEQKVATVKLTENLQALEGQTSSAEMLKKIQVDIDNKNRELQQILQRQVQQLEQLESDLKQERTQARNIVKQAIETMQHVMLGADHSSLNIGPDDFRKGLGAKNTTTQRDALNAYRSLELALADLEHIGEEKLLADTDSAVDLFLDLITASNPSDQLTQIQLEEFTQMLLSRQKMVLDMQEMLEDIQNMYRTTIESQTQEVIMVENAISKLIAEYDEKSATFDNALQKAQQQSTLVESEQQMMIQQARNRLEIAKANLSKEYASSGNEKIITPFAGTVSKRMVQVGDMVSMGMPLYELIDVPTSLSQQAKREVVFGLPEEYLTLVAKGDQIRFSVAQQSTVYYTGIIHRLSPQVDEMTKTIKVQAQLADHIELPHNSRANIIFDQIRQPTYQIPASAILYVEGKTMLAVLIDDVPVLQEIAIVSDDGEFADVQGDITTDSQVITNYHLIK